MNQTTKFKIGDLVRHKNSSPKSHTMTVVKYRDNEKDSVFVSGIAKKKVTISELYVDCKYFLYGKDQYKYFKEDELTLATLSQNNSL